VLAEADKSAVGGRWAVLAEADKSAVGGRWAVLAGAGNGWLSVLGAEEPLTLALSRWEGEAGREQNPTPSPIGRGQG